MAVIGELLVEINGDNSGLKKSLNESGTAAKTGIDKLVGTIGLAGAAWKAVDLAMKGIDYNKAAEQAEIAFGVFLGSAEDAKDMIEELRDLAKETPLEFAEVRDAGLKLQAFGVETKKIIPSMRMLADVSAGLQIPIKDLAYLFGSVKAQGKALTVDLMQFANRGIPIWTELAQVTGVQGAELKKMVEEGKIGFPQVEQAFKNMTSEGGKFFEMAVKQMDSLAGSQSNLNDNFDVWLGLVTSGLTGPLKGLQDWASNWFATNTAQLKQNGKEWEDLFDGIAKATGWGKYNQSVREHWSDVITSMRLTAIEQEKLLGQAIDIAQKYPEIHKKNNGDILKTVSDISKLYGLSKSDVEKILLNVIDVDKASKTILEKDLARGDAGKEILATAQNYDELQKSGAKEAAKFAAERKAQQDNFNAAFQAYSDKFDTFVEKSKVLGTDEETRLKGQIKLRDEYKETLFDMYDKGLISQKAMTDEIARVDKLNEKNLASLQSMNDVKKETVKSEETITVASEETSAFYALQDKLAFSVNTTLQDTIDKQAEIDEIVANTVEETKTWEETWKEIQSQLSYAGEEIAKWSGHFSSLSSSAKKFGNDALADVLDKMGQAAQDAGNLVTALGKGDYVAAAVSGIALIADAWKSFVNDTDDKEEKKREKERKRERDRIQAVKDLEKANDDRMRTEVQRLEQQMEDEINAAKKIGASTLQIRNYYAGQIEKLRREKIDFSALDTQFETQSNSVSTFYQELIDAEKRNIASYVASHNKAKASQQQFWKDMITTSQTMISQYESMMNDELGNVAYQFALFQERAESAMDGVSSAFTNSLKSGASKADFRTSIMEMLRGMAIDAAIIASGFQESFKAIGVMIAEAMKDGLSEAELLNIDVAVGNLYTKGVSDIAKINELFSRAQSGNVVNGGGTVINIATTSDPLTIANAVGNIQQSLAYQGVVA